jgi:regulator of nucleoside diphosphate kinase
MTERPPLHLAEADFDALSVLVGDHPTTEAPGPALLAEELARATVVAEADLPLGAVRLGSEVAYFDSRSKMIRRVVLVAPAEADVAARRVSVLTPVGAALIGLSVGDAFCDDSGRELRVIEVVAPGALV